MKRLRRVDATGEYEPDKNALLPPSGIVCEGEIVRENRWLNVVSIGIPTLGTLAAIVRRVNRDSGSFRSIFHAQCVGFGHRIAPLLHAPRLQNKQDI